MAGRKLLSRRCGALEAASTMYIVSSDRRQGKTVDKQTKDTDVNREVDGDLRNPMYRSNEDLSDVLSDVGLLLGLCRSRSAAPQS